MFLQLMQPQVKATRVSFFVSSDKLWLWSLLSSSVKSGASWPTVKDGCVVSAAGASAAVVALSPAMDLRATSIPASARMATKTTRTQVFALQRVGIVGMAPAHSPWGGGPQEQRGMEKLSHH